MIPFRKRQDLTKITPKKKDWPIKFLEALAEYGVVSYAADAANISRTHAYHVRKKNVAFRKAWDEALEKSVEKLEQEAHRRALNKSDTLLIFLLKSRKPEVYRERQETIVSGGDKPVKVEYVNDWRPAISD